MSETKGRIYSFGIYKLDSGKRLLFAEDEIVALTPKAFDTLLVLVENNGNVLSKEELMELIWTDSVVEENNLAQNISLLRKALGEGVNGAKYIETISKRGYRFAANIEILNDAQSNSFVQEKAQTESEHLVFFHSTAATQIQPTQFAVNKSVAPNVKPKTHYAVSSGGVNIAYQVVGDAPLDLVFVMGWVSHLEYFWQEPLFARFLTRLSSFARLILFDKRGTGLSDRVPLDELPTLEQRMTDVQAVMDAVGSKRAALLGVSEGGPMCTLFAATYPERTVALTMIGTYAKRISTEDYPWAPTREEHESFMNLVKTNWGEPVGIEARAPSLADDPHFREWWATYLRMGASPNAALALTQMNAEIDVRHVLPSIRIPSLVIHRAEDACLNAGGGHYVASKIPGAKYVELEGKDHLPFVGNQDEILNEIEEFLTGARPELQYDRVLTTVLSVRLNGDNSQDMIDLFHTHTRRELGLFKGKEIEITNDYILAIFDGPARAIRCAVSLTDLSKRLGFQTQTGLHTGECDVIGEKVAGTTVALCETIAKESSAGEILVSQTVKDLVAGSGICFKFYGQKVFEGLPGDWRLFSVI